MTQKSSSRIKLGLGIGAAVFLALLLIAMWFYRDTLFSTLNDPGEPFQTYRPPQALDYAQTDSWLSIPDLTADSELAQGDGEIFVVTPTLYTGGQDWVAPVGDDAFRADFDRVITPNYVTPYQIAGRVFAPLYRQASLYSFLTNREDARLAQQFAYADIQRAFNVFLTLAKPERPIILIGHGQGGLHVQRLVTEYFTGPRAQRLAAAYIVDHPMLIEQVPKNLTVCESETQTHCVVAFGTFTPKDTIIAEHYVTDTLTFQNGNLSSVRGRALVCVNPLLWTTQSDYAPGRLHKGGIAAEGLGPESSPAPSPRQVGAQCEDGVLIIDTPKQKSLRRPMRFGGRFRTLPSNIFSEDLRQNMIVRTAALIEQDVLPKRAPLIVDEPEDIVTSPVTLPQD